MGAAGSVRFPVIMYKVKQTPFIMNRQPVMLKNKKDTQPKIDTPILERLNIEPKHWLYLTKHFESRFKGLVGTAYQLKRVCEQLGYQRAPGMKNCQTYFP